MTAVDQAKGILEHTINISEPGCGSPLLSSDYVVAVQKSGSLNNSDPAGTAILAESIVAQVQQIPLYKVPQNKDTVDQWSPQVYFCSFCLNFQLSGLFAFHWEHKRVQTSVSRRSSSM